MLRDARLPGVSPSTVTTTSSAARRLGPRGPVRTVMLAPGATAHTILAYSDATVSSAPGLPPTFGTFELRVYPPGQHRATYAAFDLQACSHAGPSTWASSRSSRRGHDQQLARPLRSDRLQHEHRDLTRGALLILRVGRVGGDRSLPPFARSSPLTSRATMSCLRGPSWSSPGGSRGRCNTTPVGRRAALGRHHGVPAIVLHPHHRRLAHLAAARARLVTITPAARCPAASCPWFRRNSRTGRPDRVPRPARSARILFNWHTGQSTPAVRPTTSRAGRSRAPGARSGDGRRHEPGRTAHDVLGVGMQQNADPARDDRLGMR